MTDELSARPCSRRRFIANSALAAGATLAAGSLLERRGISPARAARERATGTVTVFGFANEITPAYIKLFEQQNPGIVVRFVAYDPVRLTAALAAGQAPDFVRTYGATEMPNLVARGIAADLTPYFAKSTVLKEADIAAVNDLYRFDGLIQGKGDRYGLAFDYSQDGAFWYNKKLFDRAKQTYPSGTTPMGYDDLLALAKRLTVRKNGKILVYGLDPEFGFVTQGRLNQMVAQQGKSLFNADLTEADFTTPEARRALKWFVDVAQAHVGPSPLDPNPDGWSWPPFQAGRMAMAMYGYWFGGVISGDTHGLGASSALAPAPQMGPTHVDACFTATGAFIPAASKNKDLGFRFMEFYFGGAPERADISAGHGNPTLNSLVPLLPRIVPWQKAAYEVQQASLKHLSVLRFSPYMADSAFETAFSKAMTPVMQGKATFDDGAKQLNDAVNTLLKRGKAQLG